ncbi:MAG: hypothetical protein HYY21_06060 [Candidatus Tectomicrobia bacterium]|nr:hypothetical protein [Candidatus Tectomicrobia bacterium]
MSNLIRPSFSDGFLVENGRMRDVQDKNHSFGLIDAIPSAPGRRKEKA